MSPKLGQRLEACIERQGTRGGLLDFEDLVRFSARSTEHDKFFVKYGAGADDDRHAAFLGHLPNLVGTVDLEEVVVHQDTTTVSNTRVMDLGGVFLTETAFVDDGGVVHEISYEASYANPIEAELGSIVTSESVINPSATV